MAAQPQSADLDDCVVAAVLRKHRLPQNVYPVWPKIGTAEEPVLDRAIELAGAQSWGDGSKAASAILDLSIAARRTAESEFRIEPWACDHAAS
jgi:hypothetical protein